MSYLFLFLMSFSQVSTAAPESHRILADFSMLKALGIKVEFQNASLGIAEVSDYQLQTISHSAHLYNKCGGFEWLNKTDKPDQILSHLVQLQLRNSQQLPRWQQLQYDPAIQALADQVDTARLQNDIQWLSQFPTRYHKSVNPNQHVEALKAKITDYLLKWSSLNWSVDLIPHKNTTQNSLRVRIEGRKNPNQVIVLGGHLDSISGWGSASAAAPGADDNASGSANVLEVLRILARLEIAPERTLEFFWYAGEEGGLIGSAEIAAEYKATGRNVVAVMQLDMTAFPGLGNGTIGDISDFTNPNLRSIFREINDLYVKATLVEDQCGYGCSDHASWFRQGFPTVLPFEASSKSMNKDIHTNRDLISKLDIEHSALFAKLAVAFVAELANSAWLPN